ncbi:hypothetical protein Mgra_00001233 [Meloidogyne graminicola]|uniref:Uncharacterized protein n=1 Tax=Meloidogyne graminicola TaxID=189291 RepID=A0A8T0A2K7_9BILA|nr:hypothetical protein Mgra_00001233 [Meloidogyne graminicola]
MVCPFLLTIIAYLAIACFIKRLLTSIYNVIFPYLYAVPQNLQVLAGAKWALITGGTDGIGRAYVTELAKKQFNVVILSRSQPKLDQVAAEIKEEFKGIEVRTIYFDFTNPKLEDYEQQIFNKIADIEIGVLVNNVGMSYEYPERFERVFGGLRRVADIAIINTFPTTVLSHHILQQMAKRGRGVVVNVASSAAYFDWFYLAVYSATKRYVTCLSSILRKEYSDTNIYIQTVCPMMVATKMAKIRRPSFFTPSPEKFASEAVRSIGLIDETTGCLAHQIQAEILFGYVPNFFLNKFISNNSIATRKRALKKQESSKKD